jgi:hypothetical protein
MRTRSSHGTSDLYRPFAEGPRAAKAQANDRKAVLDRLAFPGGAGDEGVVVHADARAERLEGGALEEHSFVLVGAFEDVGLNEELAAGDELPREDAEELRTHHEALFVALLPPRIGEMEIGADQ